MWDLIVSVLDHCLFFYFTDGFTSGLYQEIAIICRESWSVTKSSNVLQLFPIIIFGLSPCSPK